MACERSEKTRASGREAAGIAILGALAGAVFAKILDAPLVVVLGVVAAVLAGALVVVLVWLRREVRAAQLLAASQAETVASVFQRLGEQSEMLTALAPLRYDSQKHAKDIARLQARFSIVHSVAMPHWFAVAVTDAQRKGWEVVPSMGGIAFRPPKDVDAERFTVALPLPTDRAKEERLRDQVNAIVGVKPLDLASLVAGGRQLTGD